MLLGKAGEHLLFIFFFLSQMYETNLCENLNAQIKALCLIGLLSPPVASENGY